MSNDPKRSFAYSADCYNSLPSVEMNHLRRLEVEDRFDRLHHHACVLVKDTPLAFDLGLFLLHRHWACPSDAVMCESRGKWKDRKALITRCIPRTGLEVPTRWTSTSGGDLRALEFTDDFAAFAAVQRATVYRSLMQGLMQCIREADLADVIGLSILRHDAFALRDGERLIEENFDGISVVIARKPQTDEEGTLIPTTWSLDIYAGCKPACRCQPYSINECRHHAKQHTYKVCVPACVQIEDPIAAENVAGCN